MGVHTQVLEHIWEPWSALNLGKHGQVFLFLSFFLKLAHLFQARGVSKGSPSPGLPIQFSLLTVDVTVTAEVRLSVHASPYPVFMQEPHC